MSGMAGVTARRIKQGLDPFKSIESGGGTSRSEEEMKQDAIEVEKREERKDSFEDFLRETKSKQKLGTSLMIQNLEPKSPVLSEEDQLEPTAKNGLKFRELKTRNTVDYTSQHQKSSSQIPQLNLRRGERVAERRCTTEPPQVVEMHDTSTFRRERSSELENEMLMFNNARDRLGLFKRFKRCFNQNKRKISAKRKFAQNRMSMLYTGTPGVNKMNETVQSLDQLKKLDNDFAKRLKDAHFVISKEDFLSTSYGDVIKDKEMAEIMRRMKKRSSEKRLNELTKSNKQLKKKPTFFISQITEEDLEALNRTYDIDGRLNSYKSRRKSVDFLGNEERRSKIVQWRPERKVSFNKPDLSRDEPSFTLSRTKLAETSRERPTESNRFTTIPFQPRHQASLKVSQFSPPLEPDLSPTLRITPRPTFTTEIIRNDRRYRLRQKYTIDQRSAEIVELQIEEDDLSYENFAHYFLLLSNTLMASGYTHIDVEQKNAKQKGLPMSAEGGSRMALSRVTTFVSSSDEKTQLKVRHYKVSQEKNTRILFLESNLKHALALEDTELWKQEYERSLVKTPAEEEKKEVSSQVSIADSNFDSGRVESVAGSVGGIGAFSLCNSAGPQKTKKETQKERKRQKLLKRLREDNLRNSMPIIEGGATFEENKQVTTDRGKLDKSSPRSLMDFGKAEIQQSYSKFRSQQRWEGVALLEEPKISTFSEFRTWRRSTTRVDPKLSERLNYFEEMRLTEDHQGISQREQIFDPGSKRDLPSIYASRAQFLDSGREGVIAGLMGAMKNDGATRDTLSIFDAGRGRSRSMLMNFSVLPPQAEIKHIEKEIQSTPLPKLDNFNQKQKEKLKSDMLSQPAVQEKPKRTSRKRGILAQMTDKYTPKRTKVEWSGQDVFPDMLGSTASSYTSKLSEIKVKQKGCCGILRFLRDLVKWFVLTGLFENFMTICVTINTVALAMDHYGIEKSVEDTLNDLNLIFTIIFCFEMGLKILGLGFFGYLLDPMNYLDGSIVILSIIEITVLNDGNNAISAFRTVRIFRTFRVLRVARLLRALKSMQEIISVIGRSISSFMYLAMLLVLFMFIYALLGIQLFGTIPNTSYFNNFLNAFMSVFQIMTLENWQEVLYATAPEAGSLSTLYFISWIFIGNFILLNLFLAILLDSFNEEEQEQEERNQEEKELKASNAKNKKKKGKKRKEEPKKTAESKMLASINSQYQIHPYSSLPDSAKLPDPNKTMYLKVESASQRSNLSKQSKKKKTKIDLRKPSILERDMDEEDMAEMKKEDLVKKDNYEREVFCQEALYLFPKRWAFRKCIYYMQKHKWFEHIILILIILSTIKLIYDTYILDEPDGSRIKVVSEGMDLFFTISFTMESLIKSVALGFALDRGSYLTESWNQLDFFIVVTSLLGLALSSLNIPALRVLRILRTLRPLRLISHNSQMKIVVTALIESVSGIFNTVIVVLIVWLMFAILGVSLFMGKFGVCTTPAGVELYEVSRTACEAAGNSFIFFDSNFNNVLQALLTLFIVASLQGWPVVKDVSQRLKDIDYSLCEEDCSPYNSLYFMFFILLGSFFFLNLFVGVIFMNYERQQKYQSSELKREDEHWISIQRLILKAKPELESKINHKNKFRAGIHRFVKHGCFEFFIMACIILNMLQMAIAYYGASPSYLQALQIVNYVFTAIFTIQAILKLVAYGLLYFKNGWNVFDFIVVIGSLLDILLNSLDQSSLKFLRVGPQLARVLRVLRVTRLLRLINRLRGLQLLLQTVIFSVNALVHVFFLLLILFFIYAILGVFLFSDVVGGEAITDYNNFSNFGFSMLTLLRVSTGQDWHVVMYDTMHGRVCKNGIPESCAVAYSPAYFLSFVVLCTLVVLNLFILVILQQFETYYLPENNTLNSFKNDLQIFNTVWTKYSRPYSGAFIPSESVKKVLKELPHPLGTSHLIGRDEMIFVLRMNLFRQEGSHSSDKEGMIHFHEMLYKMMKNVYGQPYQRNLKLFYSELNTIKQIRKRINDFVYPKQHAQNEQSQRSKTINPVLLTIYLNMSLRVWRKKAATKEISEIVHSEVRSAKEPESEQP